MIIASSVLIKMKRNKVQLSVLNASQCLRTLLLFTFSMTADLVAFALYANRKSNGREIDANEMRLCSTFSVFRVLRLADILFLRRRRNRWRFKVVGFCFFFFSEPSRLLAVLMSN